MNPWLTVITVVKDDLQGFQLTVNSLVQQQLEGVEFLVIDSSKERSLVSDLVQSIKVPDHRVLWVKPEGIYAAMNDGIKNANGEYVYFANAGDSFASPTTLFDIRRVISTMDPDWVVGRTQIVEQSGKVVVSPLWDYAAEKSHFSARGHFAPHQGTFVRTSTARALGGFDTSYSIAADYALFLKLTALSNPVMVDQVIGRFVEGGASSVHWRQSFREFHRARSETLHLSFLNSIRERLETSQHLIKVRVVKLLRFLNFKT